MKYTLLLFFFIIATFTCNAQMSTETPEGIIDNFFKVYEKEGVRAAVANIYSYGDTSMQQSLHYVQDTLEHTANYYGGKYLGSELITKKCASPSLCLYAYLVKFRLAPIRFTFIFYKSKDKWEIMNFVFDSNTITELGKAGRNDFKN